MKYNDIWRNFTISLIIKHASVLPFIYNRFRRTSDIHHGAFLYFLKDECSCEKEYVNWVGVNYKYSSGQKWQNKQPSNHSSSNSGTQYIFK